MPSLFSVASSFIESKVEESVKNAFKPVGPYLRKLALGVVLILLSVVAFHVALLTLGVALFLSLANLPYVAAVLWTAAAFGGSGVVSTLIGIALLRPPRS